VRICKDQCPKIKFKSNQPGKLSQRYRNDLVWYTSGTFDNEEGMVMYFQKGKNCYGKVITNKEDDPGKMESIFY